MTVHIEIDDQTLAEVEESIRLLGQDRDDVLRRSFLDLAARLKREAEVASQYAEAYRKNPQAVAEIEEWAEIQHWDE